MIRKELEIKESIRAACIDTTINTFTHQIFLILTLSLMKRIFPWSTTFRWDLEPNPHEIIFRNTNFRDYELLLQKQQIEIIILRLPIKTFIMIFSHLKALIWIVSLFFLYITSDKHLNHLAGEFDEDMILYDRQIVFQVYMIQLSR